MPFDWESEVDRVINHHVEMAQIPGAKLYVWSEIKRLDETPEWRRENIKERFLNEVRSKSGVEERRAESNSTSVRSPENEGKVPKPSN